MKIEAVTYNSAGNAKDDKVDDQETDLLPVIEQLALVHDNPEKSRKSICKGLVGFSSVIFLRMQNLQLNQLPNKALWEGIILVKKRMKTRARTYDKTKQVIEHRNGLGDDPGNSPGAQSDSDPST